MKQKAAFQIEKHGARVVYRLPWAEVRRILGRDHANTAADDAKLARALRAAGARPLGKSYAKEDGWHAFAPKGAARSAVTARKRNPSKRPLPEDLSAAYEWTRAAGELGELRDMNERAARKYARDSASNARENDVFDVTESDLMSLRDWLKESEGVARKRNPSKRPLPEDLSAAYEWTRAAGELGELRDMNERAARKYARDSASNARENDVFDVTESDLMSLREWLRESDPKASARAKPSR